MSNWVVWGWGGTPRTDGRARGTFWQQVVNLPQVRTDPEMNIRVNPHVIGHGAGGVDQFLYRLNHALVP